MIPNIIHQLWIGSKSPPSKHMDTWKDKNKTMEYVRWNENEISKRNLKFECQKKIDEMTEINGKADIIRWEILYHYGGVFLDADSICIEPIDNVLMSTKAFAGWEQEKVRPGLIATGTMGFPPKHPLVRAAIDWILNNDINVERTGKRAWMTVGPGLLTRMYNTGLYNELTVFPSYYFLPIHATGLEYKAHGKIYAFQEWGSTFQGKYDIMNTLELKPQFLPSEDSVSILISSYNTKIKYISDCLQSIMEQEGNFNLEIVWINDGSDKLHTTLLEKTLKSIIEKMRFTTLIYEKNDENRGIGYTLNKGIELCSHEIIIKMDSDDIMFPKRIMTQLKYMKENPTVHICGAQVKCFNNSNQIINITRHRSISWEEYKKKPSHWFINHPTVCYRKSSVLQAGNYNKEFREMAEDFELELRMLKTFGYIHNIQETLLYYRIHEEQVTHKGGKGGSSRWEPIRNNIIENLIKE
jgi:GT2 family glycosyltransferase